MNRSILLSFAISTGLVCICLPVQAQDRPAGFEPLIVAKDTNGVDLLFGKIVFPMPNLQIEADPLLLLNRIQDYQLILTGVGIANGNAVKALVALAGGDNTLSEKLLDGAAEAGKTKIYVRTGDGTSDNLIAWMVIVIHPRQ